jgi:hypothetical protein
LEEYVTKNTKEKTQPLLEFFLEAIGEESKLLENKFRDYVRLATTAEAIG